MAKKKPPKGELRASAEKVWLAGLGAVATAEEEGGKAFKALVKKGQKYQKSFKKPVGEAKKTVEDTDSGVRGRAGKTWKKVENDFDQQVTMALHRLGVPTRKEIADLTRRVEILTRRLEGAPATAKKTAARKRTAKKKKVASKETT